MTPAEIAALEGHTPGPWALFDGGQTLAVGMPPNPGTLPCVVNWPGFDDTGQSLAVNRANARLIAAAPDLLAEVKRLRAALKGIVEVCEVTVMLQQTGLADPTAMVLARATKALEAPND